MKKILSLAISVVLTICVSFATFATQGDCDHGIERLALTASRCSETECALTHLYQSNEIFYATIESARYPNGDYIITWSPQKPDMSTIPQSIKFWYCNYDANMKQNGYYLAVYIGYNKIQELLNNGESNILVIY